MWYDASCGLYGGVAWWRTIVDEISSRPFFLVILSPDAMNSKWVADEIDLAWAQKNSAEGKHVIPLLYRDCTVRADLKTRHIVSFCWSTRWPRAECVGAYRRSARPCLIKCVSRRRARPCGDSPILRGH